MIALVLFLIVFSLLYPVMKCTKYPSTNEKLNNAVAILPTLAGAAIFLFLCITSNIQMHGCCLNK
ncbi:hypothetical protein [Paenibacillus larvae]|uniref:hypothetical protein n=1 Tax=Paenibacillus larvae TaxID=1464 RepID=UPI00288E3ACF|nr:hypothetical protein [Paenibacillus larvae]MDT2193907.1 hypothetical protein [Paenibacillus larvae]MDT2238592.1 hypothetical protein [Paenibacillus larvae]MDT2248958.1 hypothetical protein [Paenibacillus larvae]MDT2255400.1 hypothetical protein [Paenibacillus larvae]MDT2265842.1 hypothetical protein [Paenibacillus larvae]